MKTFKIIGVRPLKGCNKHVIKNLKSDTFYTFYNNYEFKDEKVIKSEQQVPDNLYASNISLHAIVGMNGSGKSTIVELIIRIINNLSFYILGEQSGTYAAEPLVPVRRLNAELYYEKDNVIYKITISNDSFSWTDERGNIMGKNSEDLQSLFYTIVINYSHYAYNSLEYQSEIMGRYKKKFWIEALFHKNDGYRTPIVLNPFRERGNIDINVETELAEQRSIAFFSYFKLYHSIRFHPDYDIKSFAIKLDKDGVSQKIKHAMKDYYPYLAEIKDMSWEDMEKSIKEAWVKRFSFLNKNNEYSEYCYQYLVYKTMSILVKYSFFQVYFKDNSKKENPFDEVVTMLIKDESHITLKIHQILYYLDDPYYREGRYYWSDLEPFLKKRSDSSVQIDKIMYLLPPPIFKTSFYLSYRTDKGQHGVVNITDLSSGERQLVYSMSSILYHVHNIYTITYAENRKPYNCVQIILEEIEQYYHPEYQRVLIATLIEYLNKLNIDKNFRIDILLVTHSPFVLSDIPMENILFLEQGKSVTSEVKEKLKESFGANMYDLLRFSFFLKESAIGKVSYEVINSLMDKIMNDASFDVSVCYGQTQINHRNLNKYVKLVGDTFLKNILDKKLGNNVSTENN
ncbi:AAA family ATPase [Parabacteroides distasonis]|uniref:AAA family ATPase n=1 Tax=Parabacteroides distasonis TaxID=823 RepID=UPI002164007F|nr:AAA family ATPase [Parabacteroides distasonis]UVR95797.1 AAA family ATPase [Parabacteroides distasonis]